MTPAFRPSADRMCRDLRLLVGATLLAAVCPAWAAIDCGAVLGAAIPTGTRGVLTYFDRSVATMSDANLDRLRRNIHRQLEENYFNAFVGVKLQIAKLTVVPCDGARPTMKLGDVGELNDARVGLVLARLQDGKRTVLSHTVVLHAKLTGTDPISDLDVHAPTDPSGSDASQHWERAIESNLPLIKVLLGLALGLDHLQQGHAALGKLLLCKSRADLQYVKLRTAMAFAADSPQSALALEQTLAAFVGQADQSMRTQSAAMPATLRERIATACSVPEGLQ